jgi:hypothetical protein
MPGFLNWIRSTLRGEVSASELYARRGAGTAAYSLAEEASGTEGDDRGPDDAGSEVADTASWLEICAGWPVIDTDGMKVGLVQRVLGDRDTGEFEGIDVAVNSATPTMRVPPASISVIDAGEVKLSVRRAELAR